MILIEDKGFCFLHVPKNAGSTLRRQIEAGVPQPVNPLEDLGLTEVNRNHVPTAYIREHFPDIFGKMLACERYAVLRDPVARFRSAVSQHLKETTGRRLDDWSEAELSEKVRALVDEIAGGPQVLPKRLCHFQRQADYVELDGKPFATRLFTMDGLDAMFAEISRLVGITLMSGLKENQTLTFARPGIGRFARSASVIAKRVLPMRHYAALKRFAQGTPLVKGRTERNELDTPHLRDFVRTHYRRDFELLAEISRPEQGAA